VKKAEKNLHQKNIKCNFKIGDCFVPWKNYYFDLIINIYNLLYETEKTMINSL
jgi:hypothetical protein